MSTIRSIVRVAMKKLTEFLLVRFIGETDRRLDALEAQGVEVMANAQELELKVIALDAALDAERVEVQAIFADLREQIRLLQEAGTPNLDGIAAALDAAILKAGAISEPLPVA